MPRPIIVSIEVPGLEPVQKRIAADGVGGRKGAFDTIDFFLYMAGGLNITEFGRDLEIKVFAAPFLDPTSRLPSAHLCPSSVAGILDNIVFTTRGCSDNPAVVTHIWHMALITGEEYAEIGVRGRDLELLNLFLADYGLCVGMSREDLPPGDDKPWNQEPYFALPKTKPFMADQILVFATREELLWYFIEEFLGYIKWWLERKSLRLGMTDEELPQGENYLWCQEGFRKPTLQEIIDFLGDASNGFLHAIIDAWMRETPRVPNPDPILAATRQRIAAANGDGLCVKKE